ncbi:MAG: patatin-like phospholipase family protein [Coriobacteriia bacterium]|nr:patatin-like phospholipase family protein [Coriobacteriia bacterium]
MALFDFLRRSPRQPSRPERIGLVLGGGGVRGAAHLGVLAVLEEAGIRPDVIAGTSVGSIIGACHCAGLSVDEMRDTMRSLKWGDLTRLAWGSKLAILDTSPLLRFIDEAIGGRDFDELDRPFAAVACDILTGRKVVIREGSVAEAVIASSAVPGVFPPRERGEYLLIDGGAVANLPIRVARDMGADYVIGVDIIPPLDGSRRPEDIKDILLMTFDIRGRTTQVADEDAADVLISPLLTGMPPWDFDLVDEMEELGRAATEKVLPGLLSDLGR